VSYQRLRSDGAPQTDHDIWSSIDMYNNDVGQESAQNL
jgi:hypothetical protein